jgi:hypothetical protein
MDRTKREKIAAKIRALMAKTVDNGATEDEAIAAALKVRELMAEYEIDMTEAELLESGFEQMLSDTQDPESFIIQYEMMGGVARFTETTCWYHTEHKHDFEYQGDMFGGRGKAKQSKKSTKHVTFFGLKGDTIFAVWLIQMLESYIKRSAIQYLWEAERMKLSKEKIALKRESFVVGAARRINQRLLEEARKRDAARPRGTGLVVASKNSLIANEMKRRGITLHSGTRQEHWRAADSAAYQAGLRHGDKANFNRPVNEGGGVRQISGH